MKLRDALIITILTITYALALYTIFNIYFEFPNLGFGWDIIPHSSKVVLLKYWGSDGFKWLPNYYFGNPHFTFYTPTAYIIPYALSVILDLTSEEIVVLFNWFTFLSITSTMLGIVLLVYYKSNSRLAPALISGIFFGTSPGIFHPWLEGGNYAEMLTFPTIPFGLLFLDRFLSKGSYKYALLYLMMGTIAITGHQAVGLFFVLFSFFFTFLSEGFWKSNLKKNLLLIIALIGLTIWYTLPLLYFETSYKIRESLYETFPSRFTFGDYIVTFFNVRLDFLHTLHNFFGFNVLVPIISLIIAILSVSERASKRKIIISSIPFLSLLLYFIMCVTFGVPYPTGFSPSRIISYIITSASIATGITLSFLKSKLKLATIQVVMVVMLYVFSLFVPNYAVIKHGHLSAEDRNALSFVCDPSIINNYRVGGVRDDLFYWSNFYHPACYTSRGYYIQGILYLDWQFWYEYSLTSAPHTLAWKNTIQHLLDWSATKYVGIKNSDTAAVLLSPDKLKPVTKFLDLTMYEFESPSKIAEILIDGAILFIGDFSGYDVILRSFAMSDHKHPAPMIVWAPNKCIDDFQYETLKKFSSIILYRYCYKHKEEAFRILERYVREGGRLFIETMSSRDESSDTYQPLPVLKTYRTSVKDEWRFIVYEHVLTYNVTNDMFSPPIYENGPWGVSVSSVDQLRDDSIPLLAFDDKVLVAYRKYGNGEVVWSGMNLPYHVLAYRNVDEANFMRKLIMDKIIPLIGDVDFERYSATMIEFRVPSNAKGVIFRERYLSSMVLSWKAYDASDELEVFMFGPGFNYILLKDADSERSIKFTLSDGPLRILSVFASITAAIACITIIVYKYRKVR
ncbi:MAG: 6-pyruvoyl-tetrahydropterin synthase-related protein [Nitrososphaerota archaeon]|nr:6-pyruvoyl-tetrahydropterin synthase-related protein [Aigarchaeota archaeon]MDW8076024.1 6-pyruvoyl-tetrahydropterin synthase-related protein [Nitrososphaerota archaeon]